MPPLLALSERFIQSDRHNAEQDRLVASLDPLAGDEFFKNDFSTHNRQGNTYELAIQADNLCKSLNNIKNISIPQASAALRDLGALAAALTRHKIELPSILKSSLQTLAELTNEVPRDTVFSYGPRNPSGNRQRRFTDLPEERLFISSFVKGMENNTKCIYYLLKCLESDFSSPDFAEHADQAGKCFSTMVEAMIEVRKKISPELFTYELRPYFDPFTINEQSYLAPGGAQMPVILIDICLWGSQCNEAKYKRYVDENLQYSPRYLRDLREEIGCLTNLPSRLEKFLNTTPDETENRSLEALHDLLTRLVQFRHIHLSVAKANFNLRSQHEVGSGGYTTDILEYLLNQVSELRNTVKNIVTRGFFKLKNDFQPYPIGTVFNPLKYEPNPIISKFKKVQIEFPSRLNAMAIDPSGITTNENMVYTPGEVTLSISLPRYVTVEIGNSLGEPVICSDETPRKSIVKHAALLMREALKFKDSLKISVNSPHEIRHAGLGSSSGTIAAVCSAINELFGSPISDENLIQYVAQNHGEEIDGVEDMLMPVQCIGGSAASGLHSGGVIIITGESTVIASTSCYKPILIGIPKDYVPLDSKALMQKEIENLDKFMETGRKHRNTISYLMLHKAIPGLSKADISPLGDLVFEYRFNMGSISNCSFVYPEMINIADNLRKIKEQGLADMLALSSVGPAFFAVTDQIEKCQKIFEESNLACIQTSFFNSKYKVIEAHNA